MIGIIIGSALTQVTEEEKMARAALFVVPEEEKDPVEMQKTLSYMKFAPILGIIVSIILILVWVIPYFMYT